MKPQKKIPETDVIFEHVAQANQAADANPTVLRLSIDSKAKVKYPDIQELTIDLDGSSAVCSNRTQFAATAHSLSNEWLSLFRRHG